MNGWWKFHRQMFENPIVNKDPEHFYVWCWILTYAAYEEKRVLFNGQDIVLEKGQLLTTTKHIATSLNINESKVNRILKKLKIEKQIDKQTSSRNTLITVLNWNLYQECDKQNDEQVTNKRQASEEQMTNERQANDKPSYYIKNKRIEKKEEDKKEKKDTHLQERKQVIEYLNQKIGTRYRHGSELNKKCMNARLNEGYTVEDFYTVIDKKCKEWQGTEREKYLRPETLFGNKFESYLNQNIVKDEKHTGNSYIDAIKNRVNEVDNW